MNSFYNRILPNTPPAVKGLLFANVVMFILSYVFDLFLQQPGSQEISRFTRLFALHQPASDFFMPHQVISHLFMHAGFTHIFFNMFALWMFGRILEQVWGSKRFLVYYFVTGIGAAFLHTLVNYIEFNSMHVAGQALINTPTPQLFESFVNEYGKKILFELKPSAVEINLIDFMYRFAENPDSSSILSLIPEIVNAVYKQNIDIPTVGASGAVFGVLLAFGVLFPNTELMLLFPPIPIKAKYMVIGYAAIELFLGISQSSSNIAHFAHLGGMLFGWLLIKYWNKNTSNFY